MRDIALAEKIKYVINADLEPVLIADVLDDLDERAGTMEEAETSREIASNVTHSGHIESMHQLTFTAMRIAVVTCKSKPPSVDVELQPPQSLATTPNLRAPPSIVGAINAQNSASPMLDGALDCAYAMAPPPSSSSAALVGVPHLDADFAPLRLVSNAIGDDFARELVQFCNFHGKSRQASLFAAAKYEVEQSGRFRSCRS